MQFLFAANALLGLLAAVLWGGGDFAGSIAVKRTGGTLRSALLVVVIGHPLSLILLVTAALATGALPQHMTPLLWGVGGGLVSGISVAAFYMALATGQMGAAAAVSGLLCAAVPAVVSGFLDGPPGAMRLFGFALAAAAIWLIAGGGAAASHDVDVAHRSAHRRAMILSIASGSGFGVYFVCLKLAGSVGVVWGTAAARVGSAGVCGLLLAVLALRGRRNGEHAERMDKQTWWWVLGGAVLDTAGNMSFLAATIAGRLDIAAVLASLYPATTILLAAAVLHEKTTRLQRAGMALALPAAVLITL